VSCYDITISFKHLLSVADVHKLFRTSCKKYVFQHEKSEGGYEHYQCRVSLFKKIRLNQAIELFTPHHVSVTSTESVKGGPFYCMKDQTRVEGPWTEKDYAEPQPMTRQLVDSGIYESRLPWQSKLLELTAGFDMRHIHVVHDTNGNQGKSIFVEYACREGLARKIPPMDSIEDIMGCVLATKASRCYVIDLPRAMRKGQLFKMYAGIECLKDGYAYDKRYHFKEMWFDRPQIIVFTNKLPKRKWLSADRWKFWKVDEERDLVPMVPKT